MTPHPDNLFRDRLDPYRKPAPPAVWKRIENGLDRRKSKRYQISIAAGITLTLGATFLFWPDTSPVSPEDLTTQLPKQSESEKIITPPAEKVSISPSPVVNKTEPGFISGGSHTPHHVNAVQTNKLSKILEEVHSEEVQPGAVHPVEVMAMTIEVIEPPEPIEPIPDIAMSDPVASPLLLHYSAKEVNARFLRESKPSDATDRIKSTSGLQKLVDVALDLKHDDNIMGDLRQKKDELLAFNFMQGKRNDNK
jgi:hypothetical protein